MFKKKKPITRDQIIHIDETIRVQKKIIPERNHLGPGLAIVNENVKFYNIFFIESTDEKTKGLILKKDESPEIHKILNEYLIKQIDNTDNIKYLGVTYISLSKKLFFSLIKDPVPFCEKLNKRFNKDSQYPNGYIPRWTNKSFSTFINKFINIDK